MCTLKNTQLYVMSRGFRKGGTPSSVGSSSAGPYNLRSHPELMAKIERISVEPIVEVTPPPSIQPKPSQPPCEEASTLPQSSICETNEKTHPPKKKKPRPSLLIDSDSSESLSIASESHSLEDDDAFLNPKERKRQEKEEVDRLVKKNKKKIYKLVSCCLVPLAAIGLLKRILEGLFV